MADEVPALTAHLGYWLRQVSNHVSHAFARKVAGRGVTVAEWAVLRTLHGARPVAPSVLADAMGLTRGAISKLAERLVAKGLVARVGSATDGRGHFLRLTEAGTRLVPDLAALAEANEAECFGGLAEADRAALRRILQETVGRLGIRETPVS